MKQNGQIAIVVLLISAIVMTIGLSVSKRTVVETKINTDEEQLKQAFNTAESGIDYYLKTTLKNYQTTDQSSSALVESTVVGNSPKIDLGGMTLAGKMQYFWLTGHDADGKINNSAYAGSVINLCVEKGYEGGLKVDYFYKTGANYNVWRNGYNIGPNTIVNNYVPTTLDGNGCFALDNIPLSGYTPLLLTIRPVEKSATIVITGNSNFPAQGEEISSTGTVAGNSVSQVVRVFSQYQVPAFMIDAVTANSVLSNYTNLLILN